MKARSKKSNKHRRIFSEKMDSPSAYDTSCTPQGPQFPEKCFIGFDNLAPAEPTDKCFGFFSIGFSTPSVFWCPYMCICFLCGLIYICASC